MHREIDDVIIQTESVDNLSSIDIQEPVDNDAEREALNRRYQQALSFYFKDEFCKVKTYQGIQIDRIILSFGYRNNDLIFNEIWWWLVIDKTVEYLERHEKTPFKSLPDFLMTSIRFQIRNYILRKRKFDGRFNLEAKIEKITKDNKIPEKNEENSLPSGGLSETTPFGGFYPAELHTYLINYVSDKVNPIYLRVYTLTHVDRLSDAEIAKLIHLPIQTFRNCRHRVNKFIRENKRIILESFCEQFPQYKQYYDPHFFDEQ